MEGESAPILNDNKEADTSKEVVESIPAQIQKDDPSSHPAYLENTSQINAGDLKSRDSGKGASEGDEGPYGEFNMEAAMSSDDVLRAGGFGARDGISSVLPVASDSTDFEASLLDARGYEDLQKEIQRPGLGYTKFDGDSLLWIPRPPS